MLVALAAGASSCSGSAGDDTTGVTSDPRSVTPQHPAGDPSDPPPVEGLRFVEVGPFLKGFRPKAASPGYVIGITRDERSVEIRDDVGTEVLHTYTVEPGYAVREILFDEPHIVVVANKPDDSGSDRVVVLDVETFKERTLDESAPPTAHGSWAAGAGQVAYGSHRGDDYCLAVVDLATLRGGLHECVPPRHGIFQVGISPYGLGYATFDDRLPSSCMTARIEAKGAEPETVPPEERCAPWEAVLVADRAIVWSEVHDKQEVEEATFYARVDDGEVHVLGDGTTGSLTWCGEAAWYVGTVPSQLLRWTPSTGLQLAYQVPNGDGMIGAPSCTNGSISFPAYLDDDPDAKEHIVRATLT